MHHRNTMTVSRVRMRSSLDKLGAARGQETLLSTTAAYIKENCAIIISWPSEGDQMLRLAGNGHFVTLGRWPLTLEWCRSIVVINSSPSEPTESGHTMMTEGSWYWISPCVDNGSR